MAVFEVKKRDYRGKESVLIYSGERIIDAVKIARSATTEQSPEVFIKCNAGGLVGFWAVSAEGVKTP